MIIRVLTKWLLCHEYRFMNIINWLQLYEQTKQIYIKHIAFLSFMLKTLYLLLQLLHYSYSD